MEGKRRVNRRSIKMSMIFGGHYIPPTPPVSPRPFTQDTQYDSGGPSGDHPVPRDRWHWRGGAPSDDGGQGRLIYFHITIHQKTMKPGTGGCIRGRVFCIRDGWHHRDDPGRLSLAVSLAGLMLNDDSSASTIRSRPLDHRYSVIVPATHSLHTHPGRVISPLSMDRVHPETNTRKRGLAIRCRLAVA